MQKTDSDVATAICTMVGLALLWPMVLLVRFCRNTVEKGEISLLCVVAACVSTRTQRFFKQNVGLRIWKSVVYFTKQ